MTEKDLHSTHSDAITKVLNALEPLDDLGRQRVLAAVQAFFDPGRPGVISNRPPVLLDPAPENQQHHGFKSNTTSPQDIRALKDEKRPRSDIEMAVLVAYYLAEVAPEPERKESIEEEDVKRYFKQAHHRLPAQAAMTLNNAKNAGYLNGLGKGKFGLNPVGHNLIVHTLPRPGHDTAGKSRRPASALARTSRKSRKA